MPDIAADPATQTLTCAPWPDGRVRAESGALLRTPAGWALLPPGDAGLTRRVKAAGPSWTVVERKGRKTFSRGVWAPAAHIEAARAALLAERSTEAYAKRRAREKSRRAREETAYAADFESAVRMFLRFSPAFATQAETLAARVAAHATPVGSGTVARTERIPIDRRAGAAVIAWLRHRTTAYERLSIERVKGLRREVRRELAEESRALLDRHRGREPHDDDGCGLCKALASPEA